MNSARVKKLKEKIVIDHCVFRNYTYLKIENDNYTSICVKTHTSLPHRPYIILYRFIIYIYIYVHVTRGFELLQWSE